jgi:transposase
VKLPAAALDHRRFWEAMDRIGQTDLATIEAEIGRRIVTEYGLDLSGLILDMTNFATYIDSGNGKAPIAQRGKAKQKRVDLRLVGLGLVVTRDGAIPLLSHAYPGDRPDVTQFPRLLAELTTRFRQLADSVQDLTLVYDAEQNSTTNHEQVEATGIGFVGSLPPSDHPDLLAISRTRYRKVDTDRFPGLTYIDTTVTALGVTRRAVLTHSQTLHTAQSRGFDQTLAKAGRRLGELADRLARGNTRCDRTKVEADITTICKPRWVADVMTITLTGDKPRRPSAQLRRGPESPHRVGKAPIRQADPVHQPRHLAGRRGRGRLPLPSRRRVRVPSTQRPTRGVVQSDAPLDRPENPRPRVLPSSR